MLLEILCLDDVNVLQFLRNEEKREQLFLATNLV